MPHEAVMPPVSDDATPSAVGMTQGKVTGTGIKTNCRSAFWYIIW